jgi:CheY-like chemotaxis protein
VEGNVGIIASDRSVRTGLLYCDSCDTLLLPPDRHTPRSFHASKPADLESLFRLEDEVIATAQHQRWTRSKSGLWSCVRCTVPSAVARLQQRRILIADDNAESREKLRNFLASHGAVCTVVGSAREALEAFRRKPPDMLVADLRIADCDGFDLIHRIRALSPEQGGLVPAIAVSGDANSEQALMEGYHALVPEPLDADEIVRLIEEFIHAESEVVSTSNSFALSSPAPGRIVMTMTGYVAPADVRAGITTLLRYLEEGPCRIVVDLRGLTGFSLAGASVAERVVWSKRHAVEHVRFIGGSLIARVAASAACRFLGIGCTIEDVGQGG